MEPESMIVMIIPQVVKKVDAHIDEMTAQRYKDQPLAQDWARVAKLAEEVGEAVSEMILWTGQNPRKTEHPGARVKLLAELADTAMASIYAIQHFTKDVFETQAVMVAAQKRHLARVIEQEGGDGDNGTIRLPGAVA